MRKIKFFTAFIAILLIALTSISCTTGSGITISQVEEALKQDIDSLVFDIEKSGSGYSFEYKYDYAKATYSGTADSNKNITSIKLSYNAIASSTIKSTSKMLSILNEALTNDYYWRYLTGYELYALQCFYDFANLYSMFVGHNETTVGELLDMLCGGGTIKVGDWTIDIANSNDKVIIKTYQ